MCETFTPAAEVEVRRVMAALEPGLAALYHDWPSGCCVQAASLLRQALESWMADPGMVYEAPLFIVLGEREYRDECMVDFHHWIETIDGVIIDPTAGQFEPGEPALMISWPGSPTDARYMPGCLQIVRTHERRHPRAEA
jgi:hypothetical protein